MERLPCCDLTRTRRPIASLSVRGAWKTKSASVAVSRLSGELSKNACGVSASVESHELELNWHAHKGFVGNYQRDRRSAWFQLRC